ARGRGAHGRAGEGARRDDGGDERTVSAQARGDGGEDAETGGSPPGAAPAALVLHPACALHDTGWGHPEHQGRLPAIAKAIYKEMPALHHVVLQREAELASLEALLRVHTPAYVERVEQAAREAREGSPVFLDPDTVVSPA